MAADWLFLTGWGWKPVIWQRIWRHWEKGGNLWAPELRSTDLLDQVDLLAKHLPETCHVVGWSLGGMVAMHLAARYPGRIKSLVLLACNPWFVGDDIWPGVGSDLLHGFITGMQQQPEQQQQDFLAWQCLGDRELRRGLPGAASLLVPPRSSYLSYQLSWLAWDARQILQSCPQPRLALFGKQDRLVPQQLSGALVDMGVVCEVMEPLGHILPWHGQVLAQRLQRWSQEVCL